MGYYEDTFALHTESMTPEKQTFCKGNLRISILTSQLLRVEYQPGAVFCNLPTQAVWNRKLDSVPFTVTEELHTVTVSTEACRFSLSKRNGTLKKVVLFPDTEKEQTVTDFQSGNLKGTTRTLDMSFGPVPLEDGILSRNGVALLDDSHTLVLREDGFPLSAEAALGRKNGGKDYYIFAYGHEYQSALKDFFRLTGMPPLLPKYVFGNWWSRYHAYTQEEYLHLLNRMDEEGIPLSVATIDMDWHWTDVAKRFGKVGSASGFPKGLPHSVTDFMAGWTGYSWNTELFPDYRAFLRELKKRGLAVTVNTHPAKGCRFFEDAYPAFADFMGIRKESKKPIPLNFSDKKMLEGYFRFLHHGYEKDGVDFWWIDWQQGNRSQVPGLDPLWALNHYHFLDRERNGNRPLILSRYAGPGSHRYPLGFSGDTRMSWKVLQFQPYFTATASNIGYTWWSHDIGGHMGGIHDDELYLRWLQFGVFSPINRMHSSNNLLTGKEPWNYGPETEKLAVQALQFRQRLVPYLYTMNYRCHTAGEPLIRPMYYAHPEEEEAYQVPNEYYFGSELICAPITCPTDDKTKVAGTDVWLPEGTWTDLFTNDTYRGGKKVKMFRGLSSVPVLAKAGAILPLEAKTCPYTKSPADADLEVLIFNGTGHFTLYDDDGVSMDYENGAYTLTEFSLETGKDTLTFTAEQLEKKVLLTFRNIAKANSVTVNGRFAKHTVTESGFLQLQLSPGKKQTVRITGFTEYPNKKKEEAVLEVACRYNAAATLKNLTVLPAVQKGHYGWLPKAIREQLDEIMLLKDS